MTKHTFTQKEVFTEAWKKLKTHAWFLVIAFFLATIVIASVAKTGLLEIIAVLVVTISLLGVALQISRGESPSFSDLFRHFKSPKVFISYTLASILYGLITLATVAGIVATLSVLAFGTTFDFDASKGVWILVVAAVILLVAFYYLVRLQFYKFIIVDNENTRPIASLKRSYQMTKGNSFSLILYILIAVVLNAIATIPFGLGLIITIPLTLLSSTEIYKKLSAHNE